MSLDRYRLQTKQKTGGRRSGWVRTVTLVPVGLFPVRRIAALETAKNEEEARLDGDPVADYRPLEHHSKQRDGTKLVIFCEPQLCWGVPLVTLAEYVMMPQLAGSASGAILNAEISRGAIDHFISKALERTGMTKDAISMLSRVAKPSPDGEGFLPCDNTKAKWRERFLPLSHVPAFVWAGLHPDKEKGHRTRKYGVGTDVLLDEFRGCFALDFLDNLLRAGYWTYEDGRRMLNVRHKWLHGIEKQNVQDALEEQLHMQVEEGLRLLNRVGQPRRPDEPPRPRPALAQMRGLFRQKYGRTPDDDELIEHACKRALECEELERRQVKRPRR